MQAQHFEVEPALEELRLLEEGMWTYNLRSDAVWFDAHIHNDFVEVGRSGRRYTRDDFFPVRVESFEATLPLPCYEVRKLANGCGLTTYESAAKYVTGVERAHRASTWIYEDKRWQLLYHQGTIVQNDA